MPNSIKTSGVDGVALQVTNEARNAGLVEEDTDEEPTRLADVLVYAVDGALLVVDRDRVGPGDRATLVASAARDTNSLYRGSHASVQRSGGGYKVQLPPARDAGFAVGDTAPVTTAPGMLVITDTSSDAARLAADLATMRATQT